MTARAPGQAVGRSGLGRRFPPLALGGSAADQPPTSSRTHGPRALRRAEPNSRVSAALGQRRAAGLAGATLPLLQMTLRFSNTPSVL